MADLSAAKRARMACRIHLKPSEAGPAGAPILGDDALGPDDAPTVDFAVAVEVIARFVDVTVLDQPGHAGGVPHCALTAPMRDRMAEPAGARRPLADQLRADIARLDRGEDVPAGTWTDALIHTGRFNAEPLRGGAPGPRGSWCSDSFG